MHSANNIKNINVPLNGCQKILYTSNNIRRRACQGAVFCREICMKFKLLSIVSEYVFSLLPYIVENILQDRLYTLDVVTRHLSQH